MQPVTADQIEFYFFNPFPETFLILFELRDLGVSDSESEISFYVGGIIYTYFLHSRTFGRGFSRLKLFFK